MNVFRTGQYHISDLERMKELQPFDFAKKTILKRLNYLIGFIKRENPELVPSFVKKLSGKFEILLKKPYKSTNIQISEKLTSDLMHLKLYPELIHNAILYYLQLLQFDYTKNWEEATIKVTNLNHIQSFLYHRYYNAETITEILERNQAVQLFKKYITAYVKTLAPERPNYETLEEFREARRPKDGDQLNIGWEIVQGIIQDGKFPQRKDTCMWADALVDLPDTELKYLAACYGDFQSYNNNNGNFILTMEHTIVSEDPYCSCVVHDTRMNHDLTHPSLEFFDNIWPLSEHQLNRRKEDEIH